MIWYKIFSDFNIKNIHKNTIAYFSHENLKTFYDLQELWDATHPQVKELSSDFHITDYSVEHHWDYNFKDVGNSSILMGNFV